MSGPYQQIQQCQVRRSDIEGLVTTCILLGLRSEDCRSESEKSLEVSRLLLTNLHVFRLIEKLFIRVSIPEKKKDALLEQNKYYKIWKENNNNNNNNNNTSHPGNNGGGSAGLSKREAEGFRVGRVVALTPKPKTSKSSQSAPNKEDIHLNSSVEDDWLVAVHLGERVEVFPLKYVSNDPLMEGELQVYWRTCCSKEGPTPPPEELESLIYVLQQLREVLGLAVHKDGAQAEKQRQTALVESSRKRRREEGSVEKDDAHDEAPLQKYFKVESALETQLKALQSLLHQKDEHIKNMTQLFQQKDDEIARLTLREESLQLEKEKELHRQRLKVEELAQSQGALRKETRAREASLQEATEKLMRLGKMATRWREVVLACGTHFGLTDNHNAMPDIEEVLKRLNQK